MRDRFSRVDADLEALDGQIDCHKAERNRMLDRLDSLERTVESLVETGIEKDRLSGNIEPGVTIQSDLEGILNLKAFSC